MSQGSRWAYALLGKGNRSRFDCTDPDWQESLPVALLQQDDGLTGRHFNSNANDIELFCVFSFATHLSILLLNGDNFRA